MPIVFSTMPVLGQLLLHHAQHAGSVAEPCSFVSRPGLILNPRSKLWRFVRIPLLAQLLVLGMGANTRTVQAATADSAAAWGCNYNGRVTGTPTTAEPYSAIASPLTPGGQVLSGVTAIAQEEITRSPWRGASTSTFLSIRKQHSHQFSQILSAKTPRTHSYSGASKTKFLSVPVSCQTTVLSSCE